MKNLPFKGQCNAKSTYNGQPIGEDFSSDEVFFFPAAFQGGNTQRFVLLEYGEELSAGTHELTFKPNSLPALSYRDGTYGYRLSGTATVTIGTDPDTQAGTFEGTYLGEQGVILFKGHFDAQKLESKKRPA